MIPSVFYLADKERKQSLAISTEECTDLTGFAEASIL
jgi:hypothetical protein